MEKIINSFVIEKNNNLLKISNQSNIEEKLVKLLIERNISISTAESITGGMVASRIVNIVGASDIFEEGYITYSDRIKNKVLKVDKEIIIKYSAVSKEVCQEMLENLKRIANTKSIIVTTGYAGPGENAGIAYIGVNYNNIYSIKKIDIIGERNYIRDKVTIIALSDLYNIIMNV